MPFTISHAAAALPVHALSRRLPLAALMIGCMVPDFTYFLPVAPTTISGHTIPGLFLFCVPIGLALWFYFAMVLERPTLAFLPERWRTRIQPTTLTPGAIPMAVLAVFLGAATHLAWDLLTHSSQPLMQMTIPGIRDSYVDMFGPRIPVHYILQLVSSVFGLAVLAIWFKNLRRKPALPAEEIVPALAPAVHGFERFLAVMFVGATALAVAFFQMWNGEETSTNFEFFTIMVGGMTGGALGWSMLAVALRFRSRAIRWFEQTDAK
jgi:uncharacterized protein DUF4184